MPILLELKELVVVFSLEEIGIELSGDRWQIDLEVLLINRLLASSNPRFAERSNGSVLDLVIATELHPDLHTVLLLEAKLAPAISLILLFNRLWQRFDHKVLQDGVSTGLPRVVLLHLRIELVEGILVTEG